MYYNTTVASELSNRYTTTTKDKRQKPELLGIGKYLVTQFLILRKYNNGYLVR